MSSLSHHRRSANEKSFEELQADTREWDSTFLLNTDEITFVKQLLISDVFEGNTPNLYENLQQYFDLVEELKTEKIDLHEELRNHKNDLNGMMECEDISCESFYYTQHLELEKRIRKHLSKFEDIKLRIFRFCTPLLRQNQ